MEPPSSAGRRGPARLFPRRAPPRAGARPVTPYALLSPACSAGRKTSMLVVMGRNRMARDHPGVADCPANGGLRRCGPRHRPDRRILEIMSPARAMPRRYLPGSPFNNSEPAAPIEHYDVHDQVTHDRYGLGRVVGVEGDAAVIVDFGGQQARITSPFAKLTKL